MSGIFDRLGYDFDGANTVVDLAPEVISFMNTVPRLLTDWQINDIKNDDAGGYFKNPVANVTNLIITISTQIKNVTANLNGSDSTNTNLISAIRNKANNISKTGGTGELYLTHTNKISGVTPIGSVEETEVFPYYTTAMSVGQSIMHITYQADGIQNNAPILGSYTSLFVEEDLSTLANTASTYYQTINNSITITTGGIPPNTYSILTSNLSTSTLQTMYTTVNSMDNIMNTRTNHDVNYFRTSIEVLNEVDSMQIFNRPGDTQANLINNFIGTDKLLSRLNT